MTPSEIAAGLTVASAYLGSADPASIAAGLTKHEIEALRNCDIKRVRASVATLISLCLLDLAFIAHDSSVRLSIDGLAVRNILLSQEKGR